LDEDIHSLSEFKRNTAAMLKRMKRTKRPLVLTINGKAAAVVQEPADYETLLDRIEYEETLAGIRQGLAQADAGQLIDAEVVLESLR
jgi:prevent-host-death family protein